MNKEETILNFMKHLQISREEATQLWEDDNQDYIGTEGENMTQKAKQIRRYEHAENKPRQKSTRQIKEDTEKKVILELLLSALLKNDYSAEIVSSKEIKFQNFSVTVVRHKQKEK